jgi:hypothetical protein
MEYLRIPHHKHKIAIKPTQPFQTRKTIKLSSIPFKIMSYRLMIQPVDHQYDFLDIIGKNAMTLFKSKITGYEVLPIRILPKYLLLKPASFFGKLLSKGRKMVHLDDLSEELKANWKYDPNEVRLAILPHSIIEFGYDLVGLYVESNLSIVSTYGMKEEYLPQACTGISLHEIGHSLRLSHCKTKGCIMRTPSKPENFYQGIYELCSKH